MAWFGDENDEVWNGRRFQANPSVVGAAAPVAAPVSAPVSAPPTFSYTPPAYEGPTSYRVPNAPRFNAPEFEGIDPAEIASNPAYQFRLEQGIRALQASAAARGMGRHGNLYQGLVDYGQQAASQEYENAYNRYLQEYDRLYRGASDEYAPRFSTWEARNQANRDNMSFSWDRYRYGQDDEFRREQLIADLLARAEAGA